MKRTESDQEERESDRGRGDNPEREQKPHG